MRPETEPDEAPGGVHDVDDRGIVDTILAVALVVSLRVDPIGRFDRRDLLRRAGQADDAGSANAPT